MITNDTGAASLDTLVWDPATAEFIADSTEILTNVGAMAKIAFKNVKNGAVELFFLIQKKIEEINLPYASSKTCKVCTEAEKIFNIAACVPVVGWLSGTIRSLLGQVQVVAGIALAALSEIGKLMTSNDPEQIHLKYKWEALSKAGLEFAIHGCLNTIRGTIEAIIGAYTLGMGNILLIAPNMVNKRAFTPYFSYGTLTS